MTRLIVHPATKRELEAFKNSPSHALILLGSSGIGKLALARELLETILELPAGGFEDYVYGIVAAPEDGKAIGIEVIRELEHFLSLKVPSTADYHRAIIIQDSHKLTAEAQNALLKTLEEPPVGTIIVLTADHALSLLPTIRSRSQAITVKSPGLEVLEAYFEAEGATSKEIKQAYAVSGGLPGLMSAILRDQDHPLLLATQRARELLGQSTYDRLLSVDELSKQKDLTTDLLFILQQMAHVSLQSSTGVAAKKWQSVLELSYETAQKLAVSAQPKLALTNLMLNI